MISIIGAGISGLYIANKLAQKGFEVEIFESMPDIGLKKHCTGLVSKEIFKYVKVDPLDKLKYAEFISENKKARINKKNEAYVIDRLKLEKDLYEMAFSNGVKFNFRKNAKFTEIRNNMIILADGAHSTNAKMLNIKVKTLPAIQYDLNIKEEPHAELYFRKNAKYFIWYVYFQDKLRIGTASKENFKYLEEFIKKNKLKILDKFGGHVVISGLASKLYVKNKDKDIFLIGDAAGLVKPFSGGGVVTNMRAMKFLIEAIEEEKYENYEKNVRNLYRFEFFMQKLLRKLAFNDPDLFVDLIQENKEFIENEGDMDFYFKNFGKLIAKNIKYLPKILMAI